MSLTITQDLINDLKSIAHFGEGNHEVGKDLNDYLFMQIKPIGKLTSSLSASKNETALWNFNSEEIEHIRRWLDSERIDYRPSNMASFSPKG